MNVEPENVDSDFVANGQLNRLLGWTMLVIGLVVAAILDPWFFSPATEIDFVSSLRPMVRHAQGVVLGMAFLQLAMAHLLSTPAFPWAARRTSALLTAGGATIYAVGYALGIHWPAYSWLVLGGSLMNLSGFAYLICMNPAGEYASKIKAMLPVAAFGMLLDFTAGVFFVFPDQAVLEYLGPEDGIRLRMLRLARVAVIALSVLTLLFQGLAHRAHNHRGIARRGGWALICGAIGMPLILATACFTSTHLKYLLALPASAVSVGALAGLWLALKYGGSLERWGWFLIVVSISGGMIMGLYAFDGPLPTPEFFGSYNQTARRLCRLVHSYTIVLGLLSIFLSREIEASAPMSTITRVGARLYIVGSLTTIGVLLGQMIAPLPLSMLYVGPALTVCGIVLCLEWSKRSLLKRPTSAPS